MMCIENHYKSNTNYPVERSNSFSIFELPIFCNNQRTMNKPIQFLPKIKKKVIRER